MHQPSTIHGGVCHRNCTPASSQCGRSFFSINSLSEHGLPDLTLPAQFFTTRKNDDGLSAEKALMYAVVESGIKRFWRNLGDARSAWSSRADTRSINR